MRWLQSLLGRPVGLELHGVKPHIVLVDRRRRAPSDARPRMAALREELRLRLVSHSRPDAVQALQRLAFVHDELGRTGWTGVSKLPSEVLGAARAQAEVLADEESSTLLDVVIERLQILQVGAVLREQREARARALRVADAPEVQEVTQEEFDAIAQGWADTVSPAGVVVDDENSTSDEGPPTASPAHV